MSWPAQTQPDVATADFERILLIKPSSLGDILHALPVLHGLRKRYPAARIDWLVAKSFAPILENQPHIDELVVFDRRRFGRVGRSMRVTVEFAHFVRDLRRRRYDLVIDLQGLFRSGFLSRMTGARVRVGFRRAREGAHLFYTHRVDVLDPNAHAVDKNLEALALLGITEAPGKMDLVVPDDIMREAQALVDGDHPLGRQKLLAVAPAARWETKVWPADRFVRVIDDICAGGAVRCVLLGSPDETELCTRIAASCTSEVIVLAGRTSLLQMAGVLQLADCVLCHDSGVVHVAVALDRPLVCLVGPTNPSRTGPYRRQQDVIRVPLDCAPCYLRKLVQCRFDHKCMIDLDGRDVSEAVRNCLGATDDDRSQPKMERRS